MEPQDIYALIFVSAFVIGTAYWIGSTLWNRKRPPKKTKATVVDKYKLDTATKIRGSLASPARFVVVFEINGKCKHLFVSEFSYGSYRKGEKGMLRYRGRKVVDFS